MDDPKMDQHAIEAEEPTLDAREALKGIPGQPWPDVIEVEEEGLDDDDVEAVEEDVEALEEMDDPGNQ
jgi:hypothetical protein